MDTRRRNKNIYDVRGFTLIELLAVIVVLAVVMLLAVNAVIPQMDRARREAFALEANGLITSAQQYVITESLNSTKPLVITEGDDNGTCITVNALVDASQSKLDKIKYTGSVYITRKGSNYYYEAWLSNSAYGVYDVGTKAPTGEGTARTNVTISREDVGDKDSTKDYSSCPGRYKTGNTKIESYTG